MKPEPSDSCTWALIALIALPRNLSAEEAVEEVLEVVIALTLALALLPLVVVIIAATWSRHGHRPAMEPAAWARHSAWAASGY